MLYIESNLVLALIVCNYITQMFCWCLALCINSLLWIVLYYIIYYYLLINYCTMFASGVHLTWKSPYWRHSSKGYLFLETAIACFTGKFKRTMRYISFRRSSKVPVLLYSGFVTLQLLILSHFAVRGSAWNLYHTVSYLRIYMFNLCIRNLAVLCDFFKEALRVSSTEVEKLIICKNIIHTRFFPCLYKYLCIRKEKPISLAIYPRNLSTFSSFNILEGRSSKRLLYVKCPFYLFTLPHTCWGHDLPFVKQRFFRRVRPHSSHHFLLTMNSISRPRKWQD